MKNLVNIQTEKEQIRVNSVKEMNDGKPAYIIEIQHNGKEQQDRYEEYYSVDLERVMDRIIETIEVAMKE